MTSDLDDFRLNVRAWLETNCPAAMREPVRMETDRVWGGRDQSGMTGVQKKWLRAMGGRGWTVPTWRAEYGGGGLSSAEAKVLSEEMTRIGARNPLNSLGIAMLGPALLRFGSEAQKNEHLPKIARGDIRWCQGYSEPGSGSDLVSLSTWAEDKGDHFIVNGQKVWTSHADKADWIFCLVRTDKNDKYRGISFLLFDMRTPGVSTRPIQLISGASAFCETFLDDVVVPKANLVGELNGGWEVAKYLLGHEREMISNIVRRDASVRNPLIDLAVKSIGVDGEGRLANLLLRAQIAMSEVRTRAFAAQTERFADEVQAGCGHPAQSSMMKYYGSELNKSRYELMMIAGGTNELEWESDRSDGGREARAWLRTKANSIEGGTSEIQLNIISKRILGLPSS